jgi:hypothetical protein
LKVGASYVKSSKTYTHYEEQVKTVAAYGYPAAVGPLMPDDFAPGDPNATINDVPPTICYPYDGAYDGMIVTSSTTKMSTILPIVALGIERAFTKKVSARLEVEYRFSKSKTRVFPKDSSECRLTQKAGVTIRSLICYNVQL